MSDDQFDPVDTLKVILDHSVEQKLAEAQSKMLANVPFVAVLIAAVVVLYSSDQFSLSVLLLQIVSAGFVLWQIVLCKDYLHYRSAVKTHNKLKLLQKMILSNQVSEELLDTPLKDLK